MIWIALLLLAALVGAYLMQPFFARQPEAQPAKLDEARAQRAVLDQDEAEGRLSPDAAQQARDALDRRILALLDAPERDTSGSTLRSAALYLVPAILLLGGVGVYTQVGSPNYTPITVAEFQAEQMARLPQSLDGLVVELRTRLEADDNPPVEGYVLLARSYLRLGEPEAGLEAYARAIELSGDNPDLISERDRVIEILESQPIAPQVDPDAATAIQAMSPDEQAAMIENMVEGLAVRLEQTPNDIEGWLRLIRARQVLGQVDQAKIDLQTAQSVFADDPAQLARLAPFEAEFATAD